jgi:hypothetical protein
MQSQCGDTAVNGQQKYIFILSVEAFTEVMFQIEAFWLVMPRSVGVRHQRFRGPYCHPEERSNTDL